MGYGPTMGYGMFFQFQAALAALLRSFYELPRLLWQFLFRHVKSPLRAIRLGKSDRTNSDMHYNSRIAPGGGAILTISLHAPVFQ
jgi:hypothetical protein